MPAPKNVRPTKWPVYAMDPLLNFKFRLSWSTSPSIIRNRPSRSELL